MFDPSDRHKRSAIVAATWMLPKPLRLRLRYRLLADHYLERTRRADIVLIKHPKTGSTWLRVMLFRLYQQKFGLPPRRVPKTDEMHRWDPAFPRFQVTNAHYGFEAEVRKWLDSDEGPKALANKKSLFLVRHPCDIAVSWYHKLTNRISSYKKELILASLQHPIRLDDVSLAEFVQHPELGVPGIIEHLNWSIATLSRLSSVRLVRYEDLRAETARSLLEITDFFGEDFTNAQIEDAVVFGSFENMKELERQSYFVNHGLCMHASGRSDAFKVRSGRVGGFRGELSEHVADGLDELVRTRLLPELGYAAGTLRTRERTAPARAGGALARGDVGSGLRGGLPSVA